MFTVGFTVGNPYHRGLVDVLHWPITIDKHFIKRGQVIDTYKYKFHCQFMKGQGHIFSINLNILYKSLGNAVSLGLALMQWIVAYDKYITSVFVLRSECLSKVKFTVTLKQTVDQSR